MSSLRVLHSCDRRSAHQMSEADRRFRHLLGSVAYPPLALALALGSTSPLLAQGILPQGGSVAAGGVTIGTPSNNALTITQTSPNAVINWSSFSIGQPNTVTFVQPGSTSAVLNRVTGSTPSTIAGTLQANGQVYLVNPNGIAITRSGTVNVGGGFVASTLGIGDNDFMAGKRTFTGNGSSAGQQCRPDQRRQRRFRRAARRHGLELGQDQCAARQGRARLG